MNDDVLEFPDEAVAILGRVIRHAWMTSAIAELAQSHRSLKILEIGSWAGSSCATWCEALARYASGPSQVVCLDSWLPYISDRDIKSDKTVYRQMDHHLQSNTILPLFVHNADVLAKRFGVNISMMRGKSKDLLPLLRDASFDLVYLDGSHYRDDVLIDLDYSMKLLLEGGILSGDDLEAQVGDLPSQALEDTSDADLVHIDGIGNVHPGVSLAVWEKVGRVSAENGFWFMKRAGAKFETMTLDASQAFIPSHFDARHRAFIVSDIAAGKSRLPASVCQKELKDCC